MDFKKFLTIGFAVGVAANVIDFVVHGSLLASFYAHRRSVRTSMPAG